MTIAEILTLLDSGIDGVFTESGGQLKEVTLYKQPNRRTLQVLLQVYRIDRVFAVTRTKGRIVRFQSLGSGGDYLNLTRRQLLERGWISQ